MAALKTPIVKVTLAVRLSEGWTEPDLASVTFNVPIHASDHETDVIESVNNALLSHITPLLSAPVNAARIAEAFEEAQGG